MKKAYFKDSKKILKNNLGRFISIIIIIMLGTAFFIGMNVIAPLMEKTAEEYMKDSHIFDYELTSNLGYKKEDIDKFNENKNIEKIQGIFSYDAFTSSGEKDIVIRISSINNEIEINDNYVTEGNEIQKEDECLISSRLKDMYGYDIGDNIKVYRKDNTKIEDSLNYTEYKIVGVAKTPTYLSKFYGNTTLSTGEINSYILVDEKAFKLEDYTTIYIKTNIDENIKRFSDKYKEENDKLFDDIDKVNQEISKSKYDKVYKENYESIEEAEKVINKAEKYLEDSYKKIRNSQIELNKSFVNITSYVAGHYNTYSIYEKNLNRQKDIEKLYNQLSDLENKKKDLENKIDELNPKINNLKNELDTIENKIERNLYEIYSLEDESIKFVDLSQNNYKLSYEYNNKNSEYETLKKEYDESSEQLEEINKSNNEVEEKISALQNEIYSSMQGIEDLIIGMNNSKITESYGQVKIAKNQIENSKKTIEEKNIEEKIKDAKKIVNDNKNELSLFKAIAKTTPLQENGGFKSLKDDLVKIAIMGKIFPVMFYVIAILVTVTTITRMIEEDRKNIGTLKALGYSKKTITSRYLIYALLTGLIGAILGIIVGSMVIVDVLFVSYSSMYDLPDLITRIDYMYVILALLISIISTVGFAYIVTRKSLKENAAELMRPKLGTKGKVIFIEKIPFIWNKFDFLFKICFRNIFRYKRRLFMTLIGIAGCTALIYAGLSLQSALDNMSNKQFSEIRKAKMEVYFKAEYTPEESEKIAKYAEEQKYVEDAIPVRQQSLTAKGKENSKDIFYIVMDGKEIDKYFNLRDRKSGEKIDLDDTGVVLTEKLAEVLEVKVGEKIEITDEDVKATVKVIGITENYLYNYIYFTPKMYERIYGKEIKYNELFANTLEIPSEDEEVELSDKLKENEDIASMILTKTYEKEFKTNLTSLTSIVFLFIGCASLLSFTVLINLNNINIEERKRELSTIKLLGFYKKELESYVFRENIVLTIIGTFLGLLLGMAILGIIIQAAEVETIYLVKDINYINLFVASIITILFTLITNFIMKRKIKNIDMIDSLKSIE